VITAHAASTDEAHLSGIRRQHYHEPIPADPNTGPRVSASADVATSLQTTVCNIGIAAGSLADGLTLQNAGTGALPCATSCSPPPR